MRYFRYSEPGWPEGTNVDITISEQQILREYWRWWKTQMELRGKHALISEASCIEGFCVVHWASEVKP